MEGIITARPSKGVLLLAGSVGTALGLFAFLIAAYADTPVPDVPAFLPVIVVSTFLVDGLTAYLLVVHFFIFRQPTIGIVAAAYGFAACSGLLMLTAFPGVFTAGGLVQASSQGAVWIAAFWHIGFPLFILTAVALYAWLGDKAIEKERMASSVFACCTVPILLAAALNWLALRHTDLLPPLMSGSGANAGIDMSIANLLWTVNALAIAALIAITRLRSVFFLWLTVSVFAEFIEVALFLTSTTQYTLGWYAAFTGRMVSSVVLLAALLWEAHQLYPLLAAANEELYWASVKDGLTGLFNRRYFMTQLEAELARAHRLDQPVSLLMGDVDLFKQCNDRYGHQCGDAVLTSVAEVFLHHAHRPGDFAVRYGGEEVALVLVGALREGAFEIAEQIRSQVAELRFRDQTKPCAPEGITVSIGVATAEPGSNGSAEKLIAAADRALYQAKQFGRNRVCIGHDAALKGRESVSVGAVTRIRQ